MTETFRDIPSTYTNPFPPCPQISSFIQDMTDGFPWLHVITHASPLHCLPIGDWSPAVSKMQQSKCSKRHCSHDTVECMGPRIGSNCHCQSQAVLSSAAAPSAVPVKGDGRVSQEGRAGQSLSKGMETPSLAMKGASRRGYKGQSKGREGTGEAIHRG